MKAAFLNPVTIIILAFGLPFTAQAAVIIKNITYHPNAVAGWSDVDFDDDALAEATFNSYALGDESGSVFFLDIRGSTTSEILIDNYRVVSLHAGEIVSQTPDIGHWVASLSASVWPQSFSLPAQPGQGVGMPGYGDYLGTRFLIENQWHYGWIRLDALEEYPLGQPSVVQYGYETSPNTSIVIPEPSAATLILTAFVLSIVFRRIRASESAQPNKHWCRWWTLPVSRDAGSPVSHKKAAPRDGMRPFFISIDHALSVHSGRRTISPPLSADSWARMPVQVMFALWTAFG